MQVFSTFFKICKKKSASIFLYVMIFGVLMVLMTMTGEDDVQSNFQMKALNISVIDRDDSELSHALVEYLGSIHHLVDIPDDEGAIQDNLYYRYVDYFLTIPEGFEETFAERDFAQKDRILQNIKVPGSARGQFVDRQIDTYLKTVSLYLAGGSDIKTAIRKTDTDIADMEEVEVVSFQKEEATANEYVYVAFHYLPYVLMAMIISGLAPILVEMNGKEIKQRTACSSEPLSHRTLWITLASILLCLALWGIYMVLTAVIWSKEFFTVHTLYGILNSFVLLLYCSAITLLVSTFSPSNNVTTMVSNVVSLSMSFLCGVFVPQSLLTDSVIRASRFLPAYWYIRANDMLGGLSNMNMDIQVYWQCIGVQLLFAAAIMIAAFISVRYHRQKA